MNEDTKPIEKYRQIVYEKKSQKINNCQTTLLSINK